MNTTIALQKTSIRTKSLMTVLAVVTAVTLPQVFHAVGIASGTGALLGSTLLPMHLPVLVAGLLGGPVVGALAGALSPVASIAVSGMPTVAVLPFMTVELAAYGLVGGLLAHTKMPLFGKLIVTQIAGRAVRAAAVLLAVYGFGSNALPVSSIWTMVTGALPGILLQWALVPLLVDRIQQARDAHD
jgi:uncharacterized membrane protein